MRDDELARAHRGAPSLRTGAKGGALRSIAKLNDVQIGCSAEEIVYLFTASAVGHRGVGHVEQALVETSVPMDLPLSWPPRRPARDLEDFPMDKVEGIEER
jgi:hypothetical protein